MIDHIRQYSLWLVLIFLSLSGTAFAQNVIQPGTLLLTDKYQEHYLSPYLSFYDIGSANNINLLTRTEGQKIFQLSARSIIHFPNDQKNTWIGLDVFNRSNSDQWHLDFGDSMEGRFGLLKNIDAFIFDSQTKKLSRLDISLENKSISISIPRERMARLYFNIENSVSTPLMLPIKLVSDSNISTKASFILSAFIAFLLTMALLFIVIAYLENQYDYLGFTAYYTCLFIVLAVQNNFIAIDLFLIGANVMPILYFMTAAISFLLATLFWNIKNRGAVEQKLSNSFLMIMGVLFTAFILFSFGNPVLDKVLTYVPILIIFIAIAFISLILSQQGQEEITPFMFGWLIFLFGLSITLLPFIGVMDPLSTAINAYWYALIPQALFFIFAVKAKLNAGDMNVVASKTVEIDETENVSRLRETRENIEQSRLLKVIEQERKVLGELRKSEARRTEEMRKAKEEADQANNAKSAFLAVVTHEIRTPMNGIMGMVRLLLGSSLSKDQKQYAQTIQDSGDAMLALLNDILDFEKIEQGKMTFENIGFDLSRLVQGVATLMNGHALQKNIELKTRIDPKLPRFVKGDPTRLRQVLLNLTGNAVKFTDKGEVVIAVELLNREYQNDKTICEIYFSVSDSGIGISEEAQANLFSPFSQADQSISRKFGGTGLGLAISKGLISAMGSEININSKEGEGSTFFFTLNMPLTQQDDQTGSQRITDNNTPSNIEPDNNITAEKSALDQSLKILVVDDNDINQKVIREILLKEGIRIETANNAENAIHALKESKFDIVLMDIEMPGMKGDEATQHIRRSDHSHFKELKIVALTGNLMPDDIERYKKIGMDDVLAKPIEPEKLFAVLQSNKTASTRTHTIDPELTIQPSGSTVEDNTALNNQTLITLKSHLNTDDIRSMLDDVVVKNKEIIEAIHKHLKEDQMDAVAARGHELKGMAGNFGLIGLSQQAAIVEKKAKTSPAITVQNEVMILEEKRKSAEKALAQWISENLS